MLTRLALLSSMSGAGGQPLAAALSSLGFVDVPAPFKRRKRTGLEQPALDGKLDAAGMANIL